MRGREEKGRRGIDGEGPGGGRRWGGEGSRYLLVDVPSFSFVCCMAVMVVFFRSDDEAEIGSRCMMDNVYAARSVSGWIVVSVLIFDRGQHRKAAGSAMPVQDPCCGRGFR